MFCCERYQQVVTVDNVINCSLSLNTIRNYCISNVFDDLDVLCLLELVILRNIAMFLSDCEFHKREFCDIINLICTSSINLFCTLIIIVTLPCFIFF